MLTFLASTDANKDCNEDLKCAITFCCFCRQDEERGAAVGSESRLHPPGVFALAHRSREQQRPVVVSSSADSASI